MSESNSNTSTTESAKQWKRVPFDIELAKKIQSGEVEGRIVTNEGNEVEIIRFNLIQNSFPILAIIRIPNAVSDYWEDTKLFRLDGKHGNEKLWLEIELSEEAPKHEFNPFDRVLVRDHTKGRWNCDLFSYKTSSGLYACAAHSWAYCIPYEGNEHLVGTTNNPE